MPTPLTFPGVAIEETPAWLRAVAAQPTSVTALAGRAWRGPVGRPQAVGSLNDFLRLFGPAPAGDALAAAVADFFANGGSAALVLRLYRPAAPQADAAASHADGCSRWRVGGLPLRAADPGRWGDGLQLQLTVQPGDATRFNLSVQDPASGRDERYEGLSLQPGHPMEAGPQLHPSTLLRLDDAAPDTPLHTGAGELLRPGHDGEPLTAADLMGDEAAATGLHALSAGPPFHLLCLPPPDANTDWRPELWAAAARLAGQQRALLLIDPPAAWRSAREALAGAATLCPGSPDAALYFPRLSGPGGQDRVPCGAVAGMMARTDRQRGVWKAPAGLEAQLAGGAAPTLPLDDGLSGLLNEQAINTVRMLPGKGTVVWGARTRAGIDGLGSDFKYVPVRRLALHIEDSLVRGLAWVAFEPDAEPLWARLREQAGAFMHSLYAQGAFQGRRPQEAWFVHCDAATTSTTDQALGLVRLHLGFAPLRPAEFVLLRLVLQAQPMPPG